MLGNVYRDIIRDKKPFYTNDEWNCCQYIVSFDLLYVTLPSIGQSCVCSKFAFKYTTHCGPHLTSSEWGFISFTARVQAFIFLYLKADLNLGLCLLHNLWNDSNIQVCMCGFANCCSIILLIMSSCYLAFRVSSLEQQLSFLNTQPTLPMRDRWAHTLTPTHRHTHNIYVLMYFHWPFITHNSYIDAHKGAYSLLATEVQKFTQVKWVMFRDLSRTCLSKISIQTMQTACMSLTPHPRSFLSRRIRDGVFSTTTILKHGPLNPNNNDNLE